jgi:catechol 2,3-dioxygenase-like lactoylglutathione lyase family enzyme
MSLFNGVHHGGVGVSDLARSLDFYKHVLGFSEVMGEYAGPLPGMERVTGTPETRANVAFLRNPHASPYGPGGIKLVQLTGPDAPGPLPAGMCWGEIGVAEVCVHTQNVEAMLARLVERGCRQITAVEHMPLGEDAGYCVYGYTEDPDGGKVEILEFRAEAESSAEPQTAGLTHVAVGVSDGDATKKFYASLGFTAESADFECVQDIMSPWFENDPLGKDLRLILTNCPGGGAGIEFVQQMNRKKDCRGTWGRLGPMEFAIEVGDMGMACEVLRKEGIELLCAPQTVETDSFEWTYAYLGEPDGNYVSLTCFAS